MFYSTGAEIKTTADEVSRCQHLYPNPQLVVAIGKASVVTKHSLNYQWIDNSNCLMVTGPLVVEITLVKCHQKLVVHLGANL